MGCETRLIFKSNIIEKHLKQIFLHIEVLLRVYSVPLCQATYFVFP